MHFSNASRRKDAEQKLLRRNGSFESPLFHDDKVFPSAGPVIGFRKEFLETLSSIMHSNFFYRTKREINNKIDFYKYVNLMHFHYTVRLLLSIYYLSNNINI